MQSFDTFVNSSPEDPAVASLHMAILTSGKVRGTGLFLIAKAILLLPAVLATIRYRDQLLGVRSQEEPLATWAADSLGITGGLIHIGVYAIAGAILLSGLLGPSDREPAAVIE